MVTILVCAVASVAHECPAGPGELDVVPAHALIGLAYDEARGRLILVGGESTKTGCVETWQWDGQAWSLASTDGPSGRNEPLLVYDRARERIVLYGGWKGRNPPEADTWAWDGSNWVRIATEGPSPRLGAMAYDVFRDRIVLFGGAGPSGLFADTWEFDGVRWQRAAADSLETNPPARALAGLAYDQSRGRTVLYGGYTINSRGQTERLGDTWEWDGVVWHQLKVAGPGARDHFSMTYDPMRHLVVLHGGLRSESEPVAGDTWQFDGAAWTRMRSDGPPRGRHRLAYDQRDRTVVLYGGYSQSNQQVSELWHLTDSWSRISPDDQRQDAGNPLDRERRTTDAN
jgi:hypothetical protein